eukprot:CAMPEP_0115861692 /NCGR_PEP_ID=MMETSP0287-20121206/17785_1 /TAXON_ID=412157 /ORGANISM="Chrysochromulina rotalis, Strain UIO044" /LENGTH=155 /DNA_ID=CAMNT_0003316077 /DNA_START=438 /DNA_END=902 /DNA_ORIENTATION=-
MPDKSTTLAGGGAVGGASLLPAHMIPPAVSGMVATPVYWALESCFSGTGRNTFEIDNMASKVPNHIADENAPPTTREGHRARRPAKLATREPPRRALPANPDFAAPTTPALAAAPSFVLALAPAAFAAPALLAPVADPEPAAPRPCVITCTDRMR